MKLLIQLRTATEMASYEGCALALTLATFGHEVQLYLDAPVFGLLMQPKSRLHGMIQSLELYDMPPAWLPYFLVEDIANSIANVTELGGELLTEVKEAGKDKYVVVKDPAGAVCSLYQKG